MRNFLDKKQMQKSRTEHEIRMTQSTDDDFRNSHFKGYPQLSEEKKKEAILSDEYYTWFRKWIKLRENEEYNDLEVYAR